jgi:hypothetical protein
LRRAKRTSVIVQVFAIKRVNVRTTEIELSPPQDKLQELVRSFFSRSENKREISIADTLFLFVMQLCLFVDCFRYNRGIALLGLMQLLVFFDVMSAPRRLSPPVSWALRVVLLFILVWLLWLQR